MNKIIAFFAAIVVVLFITQTISCEEDAGPNHNDVLYILNPDTIPRILTDLNSPLARSDRNNRICSQYSCQRICSALNFKNGRCRRDNICECS